MTRAQPSLKVMYNAIYMNRQQDIVYCAVIILSTAFKLVLTYVRTYGTKKRGGNLALHFVL